VEKVDSRPETKKLRAVAARSVMMVTEILRLLYCSLAVTKKGDKNKLRTTIIGMMNHGSHYYSWSHVPNLHRTEKQILKRRRRLKKTAQAVGTITHVFDKPRCRPKHVEPVPPDECERLRRKFQHVGPDASDQWALYRLDQAGQLVTSNLYDLADSEPISAFTEKEAARLLGSMVWDHCHEEDSVGSGWVLGAG
jgi:hypothetical protein